MAGYPGSVGLTGYIAPADTLDTYALQDEAFNRGGFRSVADNTERDAITADRRKLGMLVYNIYDGKYYTLLTGLTNSDWQIATIGGGSSAEVWQDLNVDSHISDSGQYFTTGDITVTIDDYGDNRKINIKVVSGTCVLKTESGIIDGSAQDINLSSNSSVEILCKADDTYFVKSLY